MCQSFYNSIVSNSVGRWSLEDGALICSIKLNRLGTNLFGLHRIHFGSGMVHMQPPGPYMARQRGTK
jgi:hypothetical protein